jgi:hypothetical protein
MFRPHQLAGRAVFASLVFVGAAAAPLAAQGIDDLGGLGPRDPARFLHQPAPAQRPAGPEKGLAPQPPPPPPKVTVIVTPTIAAVDTSWTVGASVKLAHTGLVPRFPCSLSVTDKATGPKWALGPNKFQVDLEAHHSFLRGRSTITGTAEYQHSASGPTGRQLSLEIGGDLLKTAVHNVWFGVVGFYEWSSQTSGPSSGPTVGLDASWTISGAAMISGKYNLKSSFRGQDGYGANLALVTEFLRGHPALILGYGKHNVVTVGVRFGSY